MQKLIIFDFDGTLSDSFEVFFRVMNQLSKTYRFKSVNQTEIRGMRDKSSGEILKYLGIQWWKLPFVVRAARKAMRSCAAELHCFTGVKQMLTQLKESGFKLGILSSNSESLIRSVLQREDIAISFIIGSHRIFGKAHGLKKILVREGISSSDQIYYVGDETRDIAAARVAGIKSIAVSWGYNSELTLQRESPFKIATSTAELVALLTTP